MRRGAAGTGAPGQVGMRPRTGHVWVYPPAPMIAVQEVAAVWEMDERFWAQVTAVLMALVLCTVVGMERQIRRKSAGVRTHALVGTGAAIFTLVSAYGFQVLPGSNQGDVDPSRVAAQIVTGIGFLGAGVIFLQKDVVHGLTTAASIWVSAAIGMACGSGLLPLALLGTLIHLFASFVLRPLSLYLPRYSGDRVISLTYEDGRGVLREVLRVASEMELAVSVLSTAKSITGSGREVNLELKILGQADLHRAVTNFSEVAGVLGAAVVTEPDEE